MFKVMLVEFKDAPHSFSTAAPHACSHTDVYTQHYPYTHSICYTILYPTLHPTLHPNTDYTHTALLPYTLHNTPHTCTQTQYLLQKLAQIPESWLYFFVLNDVIEDSRSGSCRGHSMSTERVGRARCSFLQSPHICTVALPVSGVECAAWHTKL